MKNALLAKPAHNFMFVGDTGSGKSSLALTIPGKKFAYLFDPSALVTFQGHDVDYELFNLSWDEADPYPTSIRKKGEIISDKPAGEEKRGQGEVILRWIEDVNRKYDEGVLLAYDVVIIDSLTLLATALLERISFLQGKINSEDARTDYKIAGDKLYSMILPFAKMESTLVCTVHRQMKKDDASAKTFQRLTLPGSARLTLPRLFSNVWRTLNEKEKYLIQTRPDRDNPTIRTSFHDLPLFYDVTVGDWKKPEEYGIGTLLR